MKNYLLTVLALALVTSVSAQSLSGVESVEYDPINNRYLTSDDNTSIVAIAPNGALSYFGSGTDASHGMEVIGDKLYTIAGSTINCYDLNTESLVWSQSISGAAFLNGMASNGVDSIWFTDFSNKDILVMDVNNHQNYSTLVNSMNKTPNGIVYDGANNRCLFVTWGNPASIKAMDLTSNAVTDVVLNAGVGNIDGIDNDSDGNWFISSWSPARITKFSNDFGTSEVITVPGISSPADICYAVETDTLAIPGGNQVLFVGFESSTVGIEEENFETFSVYYQSGYPVVQFELNEIQEATMEIFNTQGQAVYKVLEGNQPNGLHKVVLSSIGLYSGTYLCRFQSKELSFTERIVIP
ncbi:MAG: T9SS type A sorting domain-containing protein [Flavobacteriales bacterium]|nr:T9SS type A sorting domain-containing protein [Flavobacteriales bacterium]